MVLGVGEIAAFCGMGEHSWSIPLSSAPQPEEPEFEQCSAEARATLGIAAEAHPSQELLALGAWPDACCADNYRCPEMVHDAMPHAVWGRHAGTGLTRQQQGPLPLCMYELGREDSIGWFDESASSWLSLSPSEEQVQMLQKPMQGAGGGTACAPHATGELQVPQAPTLAGRKDYTLEEYCKENMKISPHEIKPRALLRILDLAVFFRGACTDGIIRCVDAEPGNVASVFGFAKIIVSDVAVFKERLSDMVRSDHNNCWKSIGCPAPTSLTAACYEILREVC